MEQSIIDFQQYTAPACWRRPEQLRGLIRNHADMILDTAALAAPGRVFQSARLALHDTERALAVALSPLGGPAAVGLLPLAAETPTLQAVPRIRWLDCPVGTRTSCVDWCEALLLLGSSRGRILVAELDEKACAASSGMLRPCGELLTQPGMERPVGDLAVSPSSHAATTLIRSVQFNRKVNKSSVLAARDAEAFIWDLNADATPVRTWRPHLRSAEGGSVVMFTRWAPGSDRVVLSGSYEGDLMLVDTRCATDDGGNGIAFALDKPYAASCADFNTLLPFSFAAASSDGTFSVFDVRHPAHPVCVVPSLQGDIAALQWLKLQPDLLLTAGTDGSVAVWNLRCLPTYAVGNAQYPFPLTDLVTTETFLEQRGIGVTIAGTLTLTGLRQEAMMALAPQPTASDFWEPIVGSASPSSSLTLPSSLPFVSPPTTTDPVTLAHVCDAMGCLYTHRLQEACRLLAHAARDCFARKETAMAMRLVSLMDGEALPAVDYDQLLATNPATTSTTTTRREFDRWLYRAASRLCTALPLDRLRRLERPDPRDLRRLEALRLNILLRQVLETKDSQTVASEMRRAMVLLAAHAEHLELLDARAVCEIISFLLSQDFEEGERVVRFFLARPDEGTGSAAATALIRSVMLTAQEPLVTGGLRSRVARRLEESFFANINAAKDAVLTQLEIRRLGVGRHREAIAAVNAYQARCIAQKLPGMFGWLSLRSIILFLHCLTADSNYVTFFWTSVQCIEAFAAFPMVSHIESELLSMLNRIHIASNKMQEDLEKLADTKSFPIPLLRKMEKSLRNVHGFLSVLMRMQLDCENVALDSGMPKLPPVVEKILEVLNTASEDLLEAWASVVDVLLENGQPEIVRKYCLNTMRSFSAAVEDLINVSVKGERDERLNEILAVCDDFYNVICSTGTGK